MKEITILKNKSETCKELKRVKNFIDIALIIVAFIFLGQILQYVTGIITYENLINKQSPEILIGAIIILILRCLIIVYIKTEIDICINGIGLRRRKSRKCFIPWEDVKSVYFEYKAMPKFSKSGYWICVSTSIEDSFINSHKCFRRYKNSSNGIAFFLNQEDTYDIIKSYLPTIDTEFVDNGKVSPEDYATPAIDKGFAVLFSIGALISACLSYYLLAESKEYLIGAIMLVVSLLIIMIVYQTLAYERLQITEKGINLMTSNHEIKQSIPWNDIGDVIISNINFKYTNIPVIYLFKDEQDVSDNKLDMSNLSLGTDYFRIMNDKSNYNLITKYYPKYMIKGPVK